MIWRAILLTIVVAAFLSACGGAADVKPARNAEKTQTPASATASAEPQTVTFTSAGDVVISGVLRNAVKPNSPALLLLHQWRSDHSAYDDFAAKLSKLGFAVLVIDGRGFGASVRTTDGRAVEPARSDAAVGAMKLDIDNAFKFLSKQPNVDPNRVGIVGASYGSSLAIIYAAENKEVKAVALLSPGLDYFGNIPTEPAVKTYGNRNLMMIAANDDKESADAVETLRKSVPAAESIVFERGGHGTNLLNSDAAIASKLTDFLVKSL